MGWNINVVGPTSCTNKLSMFLARQTCLKEWTIVAKSYPLRIIMSPYRYGW